MESPKQVLKIGAEQWIPWTKLTDDGRGGLRITGPMGNLLDVFTKFMDFEYELVRPPDGLWGNTFPNGSWSGMMGLVNREEVEFALGPFTMTFEREQAADFSVEVESDSQKIIMVRPGLENDIGGFLKPFAPLVWLCILISFLCITLAMMFTVWGEDKVFSHNTNNIAFKATNWVIQTFAQETSEWLPTMDGGRVLVTTWLMASLVFMSSYSGILTAMLTIPRVTIPIDSISDLVHQNKLPWYLEAGSMMQPFFRDNKEAYLRRVYYEMSGTVPDCFAARKSVSKGEFAMICDVVSMKKMMSWDFGTTGKCHLYIAREPVYTNTMMAIAFRRNSTLLPQANQLIRTLKETGHLGKWLGEELNNTTQCLRSPTSVRQEGIAPLSLESYGGPLLFALTGWTLSLMTFLVELINDYVNE